MSLVKKSIITFLFLLTYSIFSFAQQQRPQGQGGGNRGPSIGRVYGKVVEADSKQSVPYASVVIMRSFGKKDTIIGGALTSDNGEFNIAELPLSNLKVRITYVGYKDFERIITLSQPDNIEMDLGNIKLQPDAKVLDAVEIKTKKRVFNSVSTKKFLTLIKI